MNGLDNSNILHELNNIHFVVKTAHQRLGSMRPDIDLANANLKAALRKLEALVATIAQSVKSDTFEEKLS